MVSTILRIIEGPSVNIIIRAGKAKSFAKLVDKKGTLIAVYFSIDLRTVRLKTQIDNETIEFPTASKLNTMGLAQAAGYTYAGMILHEFYSTSPYGYALEHPIEFDNGFDLTIANEDTADATLSNFIVLWEEHLASS